MAFQKLVFSTARWRNRLSVNKGLQSTPTDFKIRSKKIEERRESDNKKLEHPPPISFKKKECDSHLILTSDFLLFLWGEFVLMYQVTY